MNKLTCNEWMVTWHRHNSSPNLDMQCTKCPFIQSQHHKRKLVTIWTISKKQLYHPHAQGYKEKRGNCEGVLTEKRPQSHYTEICIFGSKIIHYLLATLHISITNIALRIITVIINYWMVLLKLTTVMKSLIVNSFND